MTFGETIYLIISFLNQFPSMEIYTHPDFYGDNESANIYEFLQKYNSSEMRDEDIYIHMSNICLNKISILLTRINELCLYEECATKVLSLITKKSYDICNTILHIHTEVMWREINLPQCILMEQHNVSNQIFNDFDLYPVMAFIEKHTGKKIKKYELQRHIKIIISMIKSCPQNTIDFIINDRNSFDRVTANIVFKYFLFIC